MEQFPPGHNSSEAQDSTASGIARRGFLATTSMIAMVAGLVASYGTLLVMAARYLYPSGSNRKLFFVTDAQGLAPGESMPFESPGGVRVMVTRKQDSDVDGPPTGEDFIALSSICPHLGCRVHWEPHNDRFFCPCHNGVFDPEGKPVSGPPAAANQHLPKYPLAVVDGSLYIEMPTQTIGREG